MADHDQQQLLPQTAAAAAAASAASAAAEASSFCSSSSSSSTSAPKSSSAVSRPATISLPPRTFADFSSPTGFSPGPMTLVSSFFAESDDCKSFSQLLAGAMSSPASTATFRPSFPPLPPPPPRDDKGSGGDAGRPTNLSISPPPPMFAFPPGMSVATLLDSPGLGLFSPQGPFGMTHQQALAQVTAQAAQANSNVHRQADYSSSPSSAMLTSSVQMPSFDTNSTAPQQMPPSVPDTKAAMESSDISQSDQRTQVSSLAFDKPANDGYNWRKYGQKQVKGSEFPRSYYKCTHPSCPVKKKVERSLDGQVTEIIYKGQHNHQPPRSNKRAKDNGNAHDQENFESASQVQGGNMKKLKDRKDQESSQATAEHLSGTSDSEEVGDTETGVDENEEDEPDAKRRNVEVRVTEPATSHRTITEPRIIVQTTSEVDLLDDGYRWRKYGQKVVKGNPYPRSYYKCTTPGCKVRKHVERAAADPRAVITTYEGKHNHDVPSGKSSSHNTANANASQSKPQNTGKHAFGSNDQQPIARLRLKEEQIT